MSSVADLRPLLSDGALRGRVPDDFDDRAAEVLGRAVGTLARRRGLLRTSFVLSTEPGPGGLLLLRDGLVRGLLQSGHDVADLGRASADEHAAALERVAHGSGARLFLDEDCCGVSFALDGRDLDARDLDEVCAIAASGDLSSGFGALRVIDRAANDLVEDLAPLSEPTLADDDALPAPDDER